MYSDNNPLTYVLSSAKLNATGLRWAGDLADFNFTIRYRPGKANADADTLSRILMNMEGYMKSCTAETSQDELRTIVQTVQLQQQGRVNWVSSLTDDTRILNMDVTDTPDATVKTLSAGDIRQAQIQNHTIGKVYSFVNTGKRPTTSARV